MRSIIFIVTLKHKQYITKTSTIQFEILGAYFVPTRTDSDVKVFYKLSCINLLIANGRRLVYDCALAKTAY